MKRPYRAHCPNWPGMNGVTDQPLLKQCRWWSRGLEEKMKLPNVAHVLWILLSDRISTQTCLFCLSANQMAQLTALCVSTWELVYVILSVGNCVWNNRWVQKSNFFLLSFAWNQLLAKSVCSVISARGGSNLHSRDFLCYLSREQRGREALQQLKREKIRKTPATRKRQNNTLPS